MKFFLSQKERVIKSNQKRVVELGRQLKERKIEFRNNAISKLTFLYPDMEFIIGIFSDQFAGFSKEKRVYVSGIFLDAYLPKIEDIERCDELEDFDQRANKFSKDITKLIFKSEETDPVIKQIRERSKREFLDYHGDSGYTYTDQFLPYDVRLLKNGKIIGRSDVVSAKQGGYFAEKAYKHIVQDTSGSGASSVTVQVFLWNYADCTEQSVLFVFRDPPRKSESQFRDDYIRVCSHFAPFLQAVEQFISEPQWREESIAEDVTDRQLGLV